MSISSIVARRRGDQLARQLSYLEPAVNRQPGFRRGAVEQTRPPNAKEQTGEPTSRPRTNRKSDRSRAILLFCLVARGSVARWLSGFVTRWRGGLVAHRLVPL